MLDAVRARIGDDRFFTLMKDFYQQNAGKPVSTAMFQQAAEKAQGSSLAALFSEWLDGTGLPGGLTSARYPAQIIDRLPSALIVYGTVREAGTNRYAAEQVQSKCFNWLEHEVPVRKDFELTDADIASHDLIFVGRPETNSALAALVPKLGLKYDGAAFQVGGGEYPYDRDSLVWAGASPVDAKRLVIVVAGNSPLQTVKAAKEFHGDAAWNVSDNGQLIASGFGAGK